jgi:hypothetical protein
MMIANHSGGGGMDPIHVAVNQLGERRLRALPTIFQQKVGVWLGRCHTVWKWPVIRKPEFNPPKLS